MMLMREYDEELVPFTELDKLSRPVLNPLTNLATRTNVIFWPQSRYVASKDMNASKHATYIFENMPT